MSERIVWVTGASTGIGFEIAKAFSKAGDIVIKQGEENHAWFLLLTRYGLPDVKHMHSFVIFNQNEASFPQRKKFLKNAER